MGCLEGNSYPRSTFGSRLLDEANWSGGAMVALLPGHGKETGGGSFF